ncbi:MAG: hypothetical protein R2741_13240 [Methanolobus sp.]
MKLSDIEAEDLKKTSQKNWKVEDHQDIIEILEEEGITVQMLVDAALELYAPHPGIETKELAEQKFLEELDIAISDQPLPAGLFRNITGA